MNTANTAKDIAPASDYDLVMATIWHALYRYSHATHIIILAGQYPILTSWHDALEESIRKLLHHTLSGLHLDFDIKVRGKGS